MKKTVDMSLVTILIPVHYRKNYIEETMRVYQDISIPIIIPDSSRDPLLGLDNDPRVTYLHTPDKLYYEKMYEALSLVKTEFVIDAADDDHVFPEAIIEAATFLLENEEYSFCNARWEGDWKGNPVADRIRGRMFMSLDPIERIRENTIAGQWIAPNHSIVRTACMRDAFKFALDNPTTQAIRQWDKGLLFLLLFYGNLKVLDCEIGRRHNHGHDNNVIGSHEIPIPSCLERSAAWSLIKKEWPRIEPFSKLLQSHGHTEEFSDAFVAEIFQSDNHL